MVQNRLVFFKHNMSLINMSVRLNPLLFCPSFHGRFFLAKKSPEASAHTNWGGLGGPVAPMNIRVHVGVSKNNGIPKSSILIGFSIINQKIHFGVPLFLETPMYEEGIFESS